MRKIAVVALALLLASCAHLPRGTTSETAPSATVQAPVPAPAPETAEPAAAPEQSSLPATTAAAPPPAAPSSPAPPPTKAQPAVASTLPPPVQPARPPLPAATPAPAPTALAARPSPAAASALPGPSAAALRPSYGERALASLREGRAGNAGKFLVRLEPGKSGGVLVLVFPEWSAAETKGREGPAAVSLALLAAELMKSGAASEGGGDGLVGGLADLGGGALGIVIDGAKSGLAALLGKADAILRDPAFLRADFPDETFQAALRDLRSALRRRENEGRPGDAKPLGSEEGLRGLDLDAVRGYWRAHFKPEAIRVVAVGDFENEPALAGATGTPASTPAPLAPPSPVRQAGEAGASATSAPRRVSLGPADFLVAPRGTYALLAELLALRQAGGGSGALWTLDGAGLDLSLPASGIGAIELGPSATIEQARSRALSRIFDDSGRALALAMARAIAAGGTGREPFVLATEIERTSAEQLRGAADRLFAGG